MAKAVFQADFVLKWRMGVRSALFIWQQAKRFRSKIEIEHDGLRFNAKTTQIFFIGPARDKLPDGSWNHGPDAGDTIRVHVSGCDAVSAMKAMRELFTCGERVVQCRNQDCISTAILLSCDRHSVEYACSSGHWWSAPLACR